MRSVPLAMTWELFRRGRWSLIAAALAANIIPAILYVNLGRAEAIDPADSSQIGMHILIMQINMFIFGIAVVAAQGHPMRLYTQPITNASIVAWHQLPAMTLMALELALSTAVFNAIFDLGWPLWGPAIYLAVTLAAINAVRWWLTEKSPWFPIVLGLVALVLGCWYKARYGPTFSPPTQMWRQVTPVEFATMLGIGVLTIVGSIAGVARNRRGDPLPSLGILAWIERKLDTTSEVATPFRTPVQAQFWFEWQRKGWGMPACAVGLMILGICIWLIFSRKFEDLFGGAMAGGAALSLVAIVGGATFGNSGPNDANFEMGSFLASRPITNTELARTILKIVAKSIFMAWAIWVIVCLVLYVTLLTTQLVPAPLLAPPSELGWWYFPAALVACWIVATFLTSVGLTGRSSPFVQIAFGLLVFSIGLTVFSRYVLTLRAQEQLAQGLQISSGVVIALGTVWVFAAARRRSLIGTATVFASAATWSVFVLLAVLESRFHPTRPAAIYIAVVGLLALAVAPIAAAPLAVAWNRNR